MMTTTLKNAANETEAKEDELFFKHFSFPFITKELWNEVLKNIEKTYINNKFYKEGFNFSFMLRVKVLDGFGQVFFDQGNDSLTDFIRKEPYAEHSFFIQSFLELDNIQDFGFPIIVHCQGVECRNVIMGVQKWVMQHEGLAVAECVFRRKGLSEMIYADANDLNNGFENFMTKALGCLNKKLN